MSRLFPATWRSPRPPLNKTLPVAPVEVMTPLDFHCLARNLAAGSRGGGEEARELMRLCLYTLGYVEGLEVLDALDALQEAPAAESPIGTGQETPPAAEEKPTEADRIVEEMKTTASPGVMAAKQDVMPPSPAEPKKEGETQ